MYSEVSILELQLYSISHMHNIIVNTINLLEIMLIYFYFVLYKTVMRFQVVLCIIHSDLGKNFSTVSKSTGKGFQIL